MASGSDIVIRVIGLVLVGVCLAAVLILLRFRDLATERREANRLERLAEACAQLVRMRDESAVLETMVAHARSLVSGTAVYLPDAGACEVDDPRHQHMLRMTKQDGGSLGYMLVTSRKPISIGRAAALMQLSERATAALETISLLRSNSIALADATYNRLEAEASRRELETILSSMSDSMLAFDLDWRLTYINPNAALLLGQDAAQALGRPISALLPAEAVPEFEARLYPAAASATDAVFHSGWKAVPNAGGAPQQVWVMVRTFPHAEGITLYMQDVTRQVDTEDQLRQTAKMDAVGQLTGGIAHDFNNLLTVISGNLELLAEMMPPQRPERDVVELARRASASAASLTQKLLAFARRQPLSPSVVDVRRLIEDFSVLLRRTLGPGIDIVLPSGAAAWPARVDPAQLEAAILNLAINARDAMPSGGRLTVSVSNHAEDGEAPELQLPSGDYVRIDVADTGNGIAPDVLTRVFEPFFTTKPIGAGTGLGLSMVYGFAKQSGGLATIASVPRHGTTVSLIIPRGRQEAARRETVVAAASARAGRGECIMVVEDTDMVRAYIETALSKLGYRAVPAADGAACLAALDEGVRPDLLLTDVLLPGGLGGGEVAAEVRRRLPGLPVIFMSGYVGGDAGADSALGAELLRKPFTSAQLAGRIEAALHPA